MTTGVDEILQQQDQGEEITPPESAETVESTEEAKIEESPVEEVQVTEEVKIEEPAVPPDNDELNELRQFIREQRKEIAAMKAKLSRVKEQEEVDDDGNAKIPQYTNLEKLQIELHNVAVNRAPVLEMLVETMEMSPKYSDVYDICTKRNFDDIFEMAATTIARNEGRDYNEVLLQLELEVWKKPNPYKYMYSIIKENHPKYKTKEQPPPPTTKETPKEKPTAAKVLEAKNAPSSVASLGTGDTTSTGVWTAAKIDDLDESELHQVPKEVYQKYMMGKLK